MSIDTHLPYHLMMTATGPISVEPWPTIVTNGQTPPRFILLLGPTGSGKSSFIEAFAGGLSLGISKDQLDSATQEVQAYRLVNCKSQGEDICLIDTPGFLDSKLSEFRVFSKISAWIETNVKNLGINRILYFDRMTDNRMTSSRQRSLTLLQEILKVKCKQSISGRHVVHVTSMWNQISRGESWAKALRQFEELRASQHLWKCYQLYAVYFAKFDGSFTSAANIISTRSLLLPSNDYWSRYSSGPYGDSGSYDYDPIPRDVNLISAFHPRTFDLTHAVNLASCLREIVLGRISQERERIVSLTEQLHLATEVNECVELVNLLVEQKKQAKVHLSQLMQDLDQFVRPELSLASKVPTKPRRSTFLSFLWFRVGRKRNGS